MRISLFSSGGAPHPRADAGGTQLFGVALRLLSLSFDMVEFEPPGHSAPLSIRWHLKSCVLLNLFKSVTGKILDLAQLVPVDKVAVPRAIVHDTIGDVLGHSRKLGQLLGSRRVDVNGSFHTYV